MTFIINDTHRTPDNSFKLAPFFADHMVLQAQKPVRFWGEYPIDGGIAAELYDGNCKLWSVYGEIKEGRFDLTLPETDFGGPYKLTLIAEKGGCLTIEDVLFGEVILCGGQSNMGWAVGQCYGKTMDTLRYQDIIDSCENPMIRCFRVDSIHKDAPAEVIDLLPSEHWYYTTPEDVKHFSAVGYFFSRELHKTRGVPVGFVQCCQGGTRIQCWMPPAEFDSLGMDDADRELLVFDGKDVSYTPSMWYNGRVNPLKPMTVRGAIWYQGEGNPLGIQTPKGTISHGCRPYGDYLKLVIEGWRREFEQPDMPFAVVQLPRFVDEAESEWFFSREEDKRVCSLLDNVVCSINIDTGLYKCSVAPGDPLNEGHGIHPYQKEEVGVRLAKLFMHAFLDQPGLCSSPVLESAVPGDRAPLLTYSNVGDGLCLTGELAGFEVAGFDGVYHSAKPSLVDDSHVKLECPEVSHPIWVRYGYSNHSTLHTKPLTECAQSVCLYNSEKGSPAFPAEQFWIRLL